MSLNIRVIAPDGLIWDTIADEVVLPSLTGQLGLLKGHAPLITALEIGILRIKVNLSSTPIIVLGGFAVIFIYFHPTYSRWANVAILLVDTKDLSPLSPVHFTPYKFLSRCKFSTLTPRQPMVEFYLVSIFSRFPLRKKEHKYNIVLLYNTVLRGCWPPRTPRDNEIAQRSITLPVFSPQDQIHFYVYFYVYFYSR